MEAPLALYRRYRPETFAEVIGQEHVTAPLRNALSNNRVNHAYLFSGPRGCGKTTSARILARAINCEKGPIAEPCGVCKSCTDLARGGPGSIDVIEIDAASHGGVDDARDLRERAFFAPVESRYKIYIIDEAHMVTTQGFNALLKLVEEPPPHLKFIFATTEPDKVIGTIRSRTHHYPFRLVPPKALADYMATLCTAEGVAIEAAALPLVVRAGAGSVRDSLSVLDQLIGGAGPAGVTYELAVALLGFTPDSLLDACVDGFAAHDSAAVFETIEKVIETGQDPKRFAEDLLRRLRDLVVLSAVPTAVTSGLIEAAEDQGERLQTQAAGIGPAELTRAADIVAAGLLEMRGATAPRLQLELICAKVLLPGADDSTNGIQARLDRMERRLAIGVPGGTPDVVPAPPSISGHAQPAGAPGHAQPAGRAAGPPAGPPAGTAADSATSRAAARAAAAGIRADDPTPAAPANPAAGSPARPAQGDGSAAGHGQGDGSAVGHDHGDGSAVGHGQGDGSAVGHGQGDGSAAGHGQADGSQITGQADGQAAGPTIGEPGAGAPGVSDGAAAAASTGATHDAPGSSSAGSSVTAGASSADSPASSAGGPASSAGGHASGAGGGLASGGASGGGARTGAWGDESAASSTPPAPTHAQPVAAQSAQGALGGGASAGAPAGSGGVVGLADVRRLWPEVLDAVKAKRRFAWIMLSQNAQVIAVDDQTLTLGLVNAGARESFARSGSDEILRQAMIDTIGINRRVEAVVDPSTDPGAGGGSATRPSPQPGSPQAGGPQAGGPQAGGPQAGGPQPGGAHSGGAQPGGPHAGGPQAGESQSGGPQGGQAHPGGPQGPGAGVGQGGHATGGGSAAGGHGGAGSDPGGSGIGGAGGSASGADGWSGGGQAGGVAGGASPDGGFGVTGGAGHATGAVGAGAPGAGDGVAAAVALQEPPDSEYDDVPPGVDPWESAGGSEPVRRQPSRDLGGQQAGQQAGQSAGQQAGQSAGQQAASKRRAAEAAVAAEQARAAAAQAAAVPDVPLTPEEEADAIGEDDQVLEEDSRSHTDLLRETLGAQIITEEPN